MFLSLYQASGLSERTHCIIIGPGSKYAYFMYSNEEHVKEISNVHRLVPITVRGRTLRIGRVEFCPYTMSPSSLGGDALEFKKPPHPATCSSILKGSNGRCLGLEDRTTHRGCPGSVGCLQISLRRLSQISGADSAVSTSVHVGDRAHPSQLIAD